MLVLSRNTGQKIVLAMPEDPAELAALAGQKIRVMICRVDRGTVRLGLDASKAINIYRPEAAEERRAG